MWAGYDLEQVKFVSKEEFGRAEYIEKIIGQSLKHEANNIIDRMTRKHHTYA